MGVRHARLQRRWIHCQITGTPVPGLFGTIDIDSQSHRDEAYLSSYLTGCSCAWA